MAWLLFLTVSKTLRYSLFAGPFGYGRDKTVSRPSCPEPPRYTEIFPSQAHISYPLYPARLSFLFILSLIAPCRTPLPVRFSHAKVQRHSVVKYRSANRLVYLPGSLPKSKMTFLSPPCCAVGLGIPFNPRRFPCLSLIFPLSGLHVKSIPTRKPEQLPTKGKKKFNEPIKISDYAKLGKYSVCGRGRRAGNQEPL